MTKIIRIEKCDESCPYYKETPVYDNSPEIKCLKADGCRGGRIFLNGKRSNRPMGILLWVNILVERFPLGALWRINHDRPLTTPEDDSLDYKYIKKWLIECERKNEEAK